MFGASGSSIKLLLEEVQEKIRVTTKCLYLGRCTQLISRVSWSVALTCMVNWPVVAWKEDKKRRVGKGREERMEDMAVGK